MKYHPKKIYSLEELKVEPVLYKTLGGLEAMLKIGLQEQKNIDIAQEISAINDMKNTMEIEKMKKGIRKDENIAHEKGYVSGIKDFMTTGDKFVILVKDKPEPLLFPSLKESYQSKDFSDLFGATLANRKLGKNFAESKHNIELQQKLIDLKFDYNYEKYAKVITDQEEGVEVNARTFSKAVGKLKELKSLMKAEKALYKDKYIKEWSEIASGEKDIPNLIKNLGLQPTKTAIILTDDYHLYNTASMRDAERVGLKNKGNLRKKIIDIRSNAKPIESDNIRDYIFRPGDPIKPSNILAKMEHSAMKNRERVTNFMERENIRSPFIERSQSVKPVKVVKMKSFDEELFDELEEQEAKKQAVDKKIHDFSEETEKERAEYLRAVDKTMSELEDIIASPIQNVLIHQAANEDIPVYTKAVKPKKIPAKPKKSILTIFDD